jgi:hypothetical protein
MGWEDGRRNIYVRRRYLYYDDNDFIRHMMILIMLLAIVILGFEYILLLEGEDLKERLFGNF